MAEKPAAKFFVTGEPVFVRTDARLEQRIETCMVAGEEFVQFAQCEQLEPQASANAAGWPARSSSAMARGK